MKLRGSSTEDKKQKCKAKYIYFSFTKSLKSTNFILSCTGKAEEQARRVITSIQETLIEYNESKILHFTVKEAPKKKKKGVVP